MRTKFIYLLLIAAVSGSAAAQDTLSLDDYRLRVLQYSYTLKQAAEQTRAAEAAVRGSYTGFLPQLSADGDFSINFRKRFQSDRLLKPYSFSLQPALVQQIYVGGSVRDSYRQAQVNQDLFRLQEQQSELDVAYLAEYNYWNLASNKALLDITTRYEAIVREMFNVVQTRFDDGYVARNDLLMIQTRLQEAEFSRIQIENAYRISLHNFNILMGEKPDAPRHAADSITQSVPPLQEIAPEEAVPSHPSYLIAGKQIDLQRYNVRLAASRFNPQLSAGVQGIWNTPSPNYHGQTRIDGLAFLRLNIPIFHWNERRHTVHAAEVCAGRRRGQPFGSDLERMDKHHRSEFADRDRPLKPRRRTREPVAEHVQLQRGGTDHPRRHIRATFVVTSLYERRNGPFQRKGRHFGL